MKADGTLETKSGKLDEALDEQMARLGGLSSDVGTQMSLLSGNIKQLTFART